MKMTKKTREYIALGVLGVVLIIAVISVIRSNQPKPSTRARKPEGTAQAAAKPRTPEKQPAAGSMEWVSKQQSRIASLVGEVKGGRNPFKDLMMPVETAAATPPPRQQTEPVKDPGGALPSWPSISMPALDFIMIEKPVKLKYISARDAARVVKEAANAVTVSAVKNTRAVRLRGPEEAMPDALAAIARVDVAPDFQLRGVITTSAANFAVISVQGKTYSLYEGDTIPELGWTVTRITPADVTLRKGQYDPVVKRLAGGIA